MWFLLRMHCWQYHQRSALHRALCLTRPDKACRLGYKAKQVFVLYWVSVSCGGHKCPVSKGVSYEKLVNHSVNPLKFAWNLQSVGEEQVGRHWGALRLLNPYWVSEDSTYKFFKVIFINLFHKAIRRNPDTQWTTKPVHSKGRCKGWHLQARKAMALERAISSTTLLVVLTVQLGKGAILSISTITANTSNVCKMLT